MSMKRTLLFICCIVVVLATQGVGAQEAPKSADKAIAELSKKFFHYSTIDGKPSLVLTTEPNEAWYNEAFNAPCDNTMVQLRTKKAAVVVPGTSLILAFLDCPASRGFQYDSIVTFFDQNSTDVPLCFSHLALMPEKGELHDYLYGEIDRLEARSTPDKALHAVVTLSGADGGDYWTSFAFLRIDMNCKITVLSKLHSGYYCDGGGCEGIEMKYNFLDNETVEVIERDFTSADHEPDNVSFQILWTEKG